MKKVLFIKVILCFSFFFNASFGQGIRKNWKELSSGERQAYVNAVITLYNNGVIEDYRDIHDNTTYVRHFNNEFLPWHRMFIYYFEKELQAINPALSLVYWDWREYWNPGDALFSNGSGGSNGLFGYPTSWVNRPVNGGYAQPTTSEISGLVGRSDYQSFRSGLENGPHARGHARCGGAGGDMSFLTTSPWDPIFYLHHTMVDKVWQQWADQTWDGNTISYINLMGNTIPGKPQVLESGIVDARLGKVWYAENNSVTVDNHIVSHDTYSEATGPEKYYYSGTIKLANPTNVAKGFIVPAGKECRVYSGASIELNPGFSADFGSTFSASIDATIFGLREGESTEAFDNINIFDNSENLNWVSISPNPTNGLFHIETAINSMSYDFEVVDFLGTVVKSGEKISDTNLVIDMTGKSSGVYLIKVKSEDGRTLTKKIVLL